MISYQIGATYNGKDYIINITYIVNEIHYHMFTEVDLVNDYKNYEFITENNEQSYIYLVSVNPLNKHNHKNKNKHTHKNNKCVRGDIIKYDRSEIKTTNFSYYHKDAVLYKKATQTDFDKYNYCLNKTNDNSKMFNYINNFILEANKKEYIKNIQTKKEKICETSFPTINEQRVLVI